ncbi:membrane protein [Wenjunlia tyrosinilytica]|uniref:Membrane protein n=1 Tax=Wenjunlia tyrosinilytica TaxID=1544741 RepID=A0A918DZN4_9ACTN|nr:membrane protein [Wenjunlia tyrosinilytica]
MAARWGLAARGVIYLLVGVLALRIAFGDNGEQADRGGALHALAKQPFGSALVWAVGVGLAGMALWRLSEAVFGAAGPDGRKTSKRLASAGRFVFYTVVAYSVLSFAAGEKGSGSSDKQSQDVTSRVMDLPAGRWLVGIGGIVIACAGVWIAFRAIQRKYHKHLKLSEMSPRIRKAVDVLGVGGGVARGAVFAVAGGFAVAAAVRYDPDKAKGIDDTLRTFSRTAAGPWLLVAVAVGLALFGLFSFAMARWRRV